MFRSTRLLPMAPITAMQQDLQAFLLDEQQLFEDQPTEKYPVTPMPASEQVTDECPSVSAYYREDLDIVSLVVEAVCDALYRTQIAPGAILVSAANWLLLLKLGLDAFTLPCYGKFLDIPILIASSLDDDTVFCTRRR